MGAPVTFQRLYRDGAGPEYRATPVAVSNVLRSMNAAAKHEWNDFRVLFRLDDGTSVIAKPKRSV